MLSQDLLKLYRINKLSDLGQNFIFDRNFCKTILSYLPSNIEEKRICEIGPGVGIFTAALKELNPRELLLFEKDVRLKPILSEYTVQWGDYLKLEKPRSTIPTWVVGNLPFNVSTRILLQCLRDMHYKQGLNPEGCYFMFQKEVAKRICALVDDNNRGRLTFMSQIYSDVEYVKTVDKAVFSPMPKVDGAMVLFKKKKQSATLPDFDEMSLFLRNLCRNPRKAVKLHSCMGKRIHQLNEDEVVDLFIKDRMLE